MTTSVDLLVDRICATFVICHLICVATVLYQIDLDAKEEQT